MGNQMKRIETCRFEALRWHSSSQKKKKRKPLPFYFHLQAFTADGKESRIDRIALAWKNLGCATMSAETLCDLILVLSHSTAGAYYQLREGLRLGPIPADIRFQLADRARIAELLDSLGRFWNASARLLKDTGFEEYRKLDPHAPGDTHVIDWFLWVRCGIHIPLGAPCFSERTSREFLPFVSGKASFSELQQLADWYEYATLLDGGGYLCPLLTHISRNRNPAAAARWCELLLEDVGSLVLDVKHW